jgi:hypothetical protein
MASLAQVWLELPVLRAHTRGLPWAVVSREAQQAPEVLQAQALLSLVLRVRAWLGQ